MYSGAEWHLDVIDKADDWILSILDDEDIAELPYIDRLGAHGTAVIWRELDRLLEDESGNRRDEIVNEKLDVLEKHLALVFHRFLAGEIRGRSRIAITVNGHPVEAFDPFCRKNTHTRHLPEEIVRIGSATVHLQPYILPHHSNLTAREYDFYQTRSDFISNQGAYIYRNGRLMAWGDWFRLIPKGEATKLARVQIDFPNSLDEAWTIDIKKSRSRPPLAVRERLRQIIAQVSGASTTVHRGRGQKLFHEVDGPAVGALCRQIRYPICAETGRIRWSSACTRSWTAKASVTSIFCLNPLPRRCRWRWSIPTIRRQPRDVSQTPPVENMTERLDDLRKALWGDAPGNAEAFRDIVRSTRLFGDHGEIVENYIKGGFA